MQDLWLLPGGCSEADDLLDGPGDFGDQVLAFGASDIGTAIIYAVVFAGLLTLSYYAGPTRYSADYLLIGTAPPALRNRALALAGAGIMFTQGAGFALWGTAGQYLPPTAAIALAAAASALATTILRPHKPPRPCPSSATGTIHP